MDTNEDFTEDPLSEPWRVRRYTPSTWMSAMIYSATVLRYSARLMSSTP
jgi:hypothetical protein